LVAKLLKCSKKSKYSDFLEHFSKKDRIYARQAPVFFYSCLYAGITVKYLFNYFFNFLFIFFTFVLKLFFSKN